MKLQDLLKDIELGKVYTDKDRKPFKVNEDGHTDVPSAIRKLKLSIEDSEELLKKLESMDKESSLPAWWTDKVTLASNYLNKSRDYLLTGSKVDEGFGGVNALNVCCFGVCFEFTAGICSRVVSSSAKPSRCVEFSCSSCSLADSFASV